MTRNTDVSEFFNDLDAGVFAEKLGHALSDVAMGVAEYDKAGKVTITLDLTRIGSGTQVKVKSKLAYVRPTKRGKASEESTTETPMHVNSGGAVTLFPEDQTQLFDKHGQATAKTK